MKTIQTEFILLSIFHRRLQCPLYEFMNRQMSVSIQQLTVTSDVCLPFSLTQALEFMCSASIGGDIRSSMCACTQCLDGGHMRKWCVYAHVRIHQCMRYASVAVRMDKTKSS